MPGQLPAWQVLSQTTLHLVARLEMARLYTCSIWLLSSTTPDPRTTVWLLILWLVAASPSLRRATRRPRSRSLELGSQGMKTKFIGNQAERRFLRADSQAPVLAQATNRGARASDAYGETGKQTG